MKSLVQLMRYMRPYKFIVVLGILTVILPVSMELVVPRLLQYVIDDGIRAGDMAEVWRGSLLLLGAALVSASATLGQGIARARLSQGMAFDMRNDLFRHIQSLPFATLDALQTGGLMTRISSDVNLIRMFSSNGLALLLRAVLMMLGSLVLVFATDWQLALIMLLSLVIAGVMLAGFMRVSQPLFMVVQEKLSVLNTIVQENLAGARVVKAFVREQHAIEQFDDFNQDYMSATIKVHRILALVMPTLTVLTNVGIVAVIGFGGLDVINGRLSLGELVAFNNYLMIGMTPLLLFSNMVTMAARAEASASRVLELFDHAPQPHRGAAAHQADAIQGHIAFEDVTFRYARPNGTNGGHEADDDVLRQISFAVKPGQRVALLGTTGSGKSTMISLIARFYDVTGGRVLVDDVDVRDWDPEALRTQTGIVLQQTTLFSGTVRENIAYGQPDAPLETVMAAAQAAQAHDFIMQMPDGYDSIVEARGANLSGGQKQRIAIARALLTAPGILIMDDSTSSVDVETEIKIQDALESRLAQTTTFVVAQRINSVLTADQIMILDAGQIVAAGTHAELLESNAIYQEIYHSQFGTETLA